MYMREFRLKNLNDYGISKDKEKAILEWCRKNKEPGILYELCLAVNSEIAKELYYHLTTGISYDRMPAVPMCRVDFYAYRRLVIAGIAKTEM